MSEQRFGKVGNVGKVGRLFERCRNCGCPRGLHWVYAREKFVPPKRPAAEGEHAQ